MTLPAVAIAASIGSGLISAVGAIGSANAQSAAQEQQAQIAERNKILADQDRQMAIRTSQIAQDDAAREHRRQLSSIRAAYGSSGVELSGSPLEVLQDTSIEMALDERRIGYEGQVKSREGTVKMLGLQEEANSARSAAKYTKKAGMMSATSSFLSGVGSATDMYVRYYK